MNIFYLDKNPKVAASFMYNKHVIKMILESAQLLCTAHHILDSATEVPYKPTHKNHPCALWVRQSTAHYNWLYKHMMALGHEYTSRYGKIHKTIEKCEQVLKSPPASLPATDFEQPPQCMPDLYHDSCSVEAYWDYYICEKFHVAGLYEDIYTSKPEIRNA